MKHNSRTAPTVDDEDDDGPEQALLSDDDLERFGADEEEVALISELAGEFRAATDEESVLAFQFALSNRLGMSLLSSSYSQRRMGGPLDADEMNAGLKLLALSLKQMKQLNAQRLLRAMTVRAKTVRANKRVARQDGGDDGEQ